MVWLRRELPWLDTAFLPRVPAERLDDLLLDLGRLGFAIFMLEGERMTDETECYAEVTRALGFWGNWQGNPDAFIDFIADVDFSRRAAIVWTSIRTIAAADPIVFARVVSLLTLAREGTPTETSQVEIFLSE